MGMIRLLLAVLYLVLYLVLSMPYALILWLIGKKDPAFADRASYRFVSWGFGCEWAITGSSLQVEGTEKIPSDRSVLFIANHRSIFDIILLCKVIPGPMGIIAKDTMKKVPLLNVWMNMLHCKYLDRKDVKQGLKVILSAIDEVKSGQSMLIFPEGTRNKTDEPLLEFHAGSFKIATKAGAPVVPVTITGTRDIFEAHKPFIRPSSVTVTFSDPVETAGMDREALKNLPETVRDTILQVYQAKTNG